MVGKQIHARQQEIEALLDELSKECVLRRQAAAIGCVLTEACRFADEVKQEQGQTIVDSITWRIKTADSIAEKLRRKGMDISYENATLQLGDLIGIRIVCPFQDDVYRVAAYIKNCSRFAVAKDKDYIKRPKKSGYRSLHLIVWVPVSEDGTETRVRVEIQIRSLAMNFWAKVDHQLCYKQKGLSAEEKRRIRRELSDYAQSIDQIDRNMTRLRKFNKRFNCDQGENIVK